MNDAKDDLGTFAPVPRRITVADQDFEVLPLRLRQLPAFTKAVEPALPALLSGDFQTAIHRHQDGMVEAVAVATGADRDWLGELYPDDFIRLARVVLEVNVDFFGRRVMPELSAAAEGLSKVMAAFRGAASSPGSADADTDSTTAST